MYIDINITDALDDCNAWEIKSVIEWLKNNDYITDSSIETTENPNLMELEWEQTISKLHSKRVYLTQEEEQTIKNIVSRF